MIRAQMDTGISRDASKLTGQQKRACHNRTLGQLFVVRMAMLLE